MLAASMVRAAAAITAQVGGEVIPSGKPGGLAMAIRGPAGMVLGTAPYDASIILGVRPSGDQARRLHGFSPCRPDHRRSAVEHLEPVLLGPGGKAPLIVPGDAGLDETVKAAAFGAFMNQGQICVSTERQFIDGKIHKPGLGGSDTSRSA